MISLELELKCLGGSLLYNWAGELVILYSSLNQCSVLQAYIQALYRFLDFGDVLVCQVIVRFD